MQTRNDDGSTEQSQWDRMVAGKLYNAFDHELLERRATARRLCRKLNSEDVADPSHEATVRELLGIVGANPYIEPPFRCDYGMNITVGDNFYANYDCIILDACPVTIGDNVLFAPRVILTTATRPTDADARRAGQEIGKLIAIGDNVWVCAIRASSRRPSRRHRLPRFRGFAWRPCGGVRRPAGRTRRRPPR